VVVLCCLEKTFRAGFFVVTESIFSFLIPSLIVISTLSEVQEISVRTLKYYSLHCCLCYFRIRNLGCVCVCMCVCVCVCVCVCFPKQNCRKVDFSVIILAI
jgi:hypothetical protein